MTSWESRFSEEIIYFGLLNLLFTQNVTANFNIHSNSAVNKNFCRTIKFLKKRAENLKIIYKKVRHKKMLKIILYFLVVKKKNLHHQN